MELGSIEQQYRKAKRATWLRMFDMCHLVDWCCVREWANGNIAK